MTITPKKADDDDTDALDALDAEAKEFTKVCSLLILFLLKHG